MTLENCNTCKKELYDKYSKTKNGVIVFIYNNQKNSSKTRSHPMPCYTLDELRGWALKQEIFHKIYNSWVKSGYQMMLKPSFDRTDDYQGYSLDRLKIMTWRENLDKANKDRVDGINNKISKAVIQFKIDGSFVKYHYSGQQAYRDTGISQPNISNCCIGKRLTAGGFKWSHA